MRKVELRAALERGLVKRIAHATYVRSDYTGAAPPCPANALRRCRERESIIRARLLRLLVEQRHEAELCRLADAKLTEIRQALHGLWLNGLLIGDNANGYRLRGHASRKSRRAIRNVPA